MWRQLTLNESFDLVQRTADKAMTFAAGKVWEGAPDSNFGKVPGGRGVYYPSLSAHAFTARRPGFSALL